MSRRIALPYLTLSDLSVNATAWAYSLNGGAFSDVEEYLPNWDAASTIVARRTVRVDSPLAASELDVDAASLVMSVRVRVGTGPGRLPRVVVKESRAELPVDGSAVEVALEIPGDDLSAVLDLFTEIVLISPPAGAGRLSPGANGERIWQDRARIRLEGDEPRFPIEVADFRSLLGDVPAADSPWYLHWSPRDWSRDFHGAIRLFLNSRDAEMIARVEGQDEPTLRALLADVMSQVCERFVADHATADADLSYDGGTLGGQAMSWLALAWPGRDPSFTASLFQSRPGEFRAAFLALAETRET